MSGTFKSITRRPFWSTGKIWLFWIMLGILLTIGFMLVSGSPALIHLIQP